MGNSVMAPTICERCEKIFSGGVNAYCCPKCREKIIRDKIRDAAMRKERDRELAEIRERRKTK